MANRKGKSGNTEKFYFLSSKITVNGNCCHEIKRYLLLGKRVMTNLDNILKSRERLIQDDGIERCVLIIS